MNNLAPADLHSLRAGPFPGQSIHRPEKKHWYYEPMYGAFYPIGYQQRCTCALMNSPSQFSFVKTHVLNTRLTRSTASKAAYKLILASNSQDVYCPETFPLRLVKFHLAMSLRPPPPEHCFTSRHIPLINAASIRRILLTIYKFNHLLSKMVYIILRNEKIKLLILKVFFCCQVGKTAFPFVSKRTLFPCFCRNSPIATSWSSRFPRRK